MPPPSGQNRGVRRPPHPEDYTARQSRPNESTIHNVNNTPRLLNADRIHLQVTFASQSGDAVSYRQTFDIRDQDAGSEIARMFGLPQSSGHVSRNAMSTPVAGLPQPVGRSQLEGYQREYLRHDGLDGFRVPDVNPRRGHQGGRQRHEPMERSHPETYQREYLRHDGLDGFRVPDVNPRRGHQGGRQRHEPMGRSHPETYQREYLRHDGLDGFRVPNVNPRRGHQGGHQRQGYRPRYNNAHARNDDPLNHPYYSRYTPRFPGSNQNGGAVNEHRAITAVQQRDTGDVEEDATAGGATSEVEQGVVADSSKGHDTEAAENREGSESPLIEF